MDTTPQLPPHEIVHRANGLTGVKNMCVKKDLPHGLVMVSVMTVPIAMIKVLWTSIVPIMTLMVSTVVVMTTIRTTSMALHPHVWIVVPLSSALLLCVGSQTRTTSPASGYPMCWEVAMSLC